MVLAYSDGSASAQAGEVAVSPDADPSAIGLERTLKAAMRLAGCEAGAVFLREGEYFSAKLAQSGNAAQLFSDFDLSAISIEVGETRLVNESAEIATFFPCRDEMQSAKAQTVFLTGFNAAASDLGEDKNEGVIVLISKTKKTSDNLDLSLLLDFGAIAGSLVQTRRKTSKALETLERSEKQTEHFDYVTELAGVGGWEIEPATQKIFWTEQTCRIHDRPPDYSPSLQEWFDMCDPAYRKSLQTAFREAVASGTGWKIDLPIQTATGRRIWVASICQPVFGDDGELLLVGSIMDVSARRAAETEIDRSQRLYRSTLNALSEGILVVDGEGIVRWHNAAAETIFECPTIYAEMTHLEDVPCLVEPADMHALFDQERAYDDYNLLSGLLILKQSKSLTLQAKVGEDQTRKWLRCRSEPLISREDKKFVGLVISVEDITAKKRSEDILNEAFEAIPNGIAVFDQDDRMVMANGAYRVAFTDGKLPSGEAETYRDVLSRNLASGRIADVEDNAAVREAWVEDRASDFFGGSVSHIDRLDDSRWLQTSSMITPSSYRADFFADVTELKTQGAVLEAVFENFPGGVALFDARRNLTLINTGMKELLGIDDGFMRSGPTLRSMVARNASREGLTGDALDAAVAKTIDRFTRSEVVTYERVLSDGTVHEIKAISLPDGGLLTTLDDISLRKHLEQQLRDNAHRAKKKSAELEATFANMTQGVSVFDAEGCLQIWNQRYIDIFSKPDGEVRHGVAIQTLLDAEKLRGDFEGDVEAHIAQLRQRLQAGETVRSYFKLKTGTLIGTIHAPMPGGGWIGTHDEIAEDDKDYKAFRRSRQTDPQTKVANQAYLLEDMELALDSVRLNGGSCGVMVISVGFAHYYALGEHMAPCDQTNQIIARRLREAVRPMDLVARLDDGRFAVLFPTLRNDDGAVRIMAERIMSLLREPVVVSGQKTLLTVHLGLVRLTDQVETSELALQKAQTTVDFASVKGPVSLAVDLI
ncbi:PAS-domain containing protein [uncultured Roseibium sp.]|uniref:PAS-domain containing protein n=1 Tax=uncultured Roseibium sp. TaxID=1936171 RepID=UPI0025955A24|nr:PAS-domain containing protein [uncultured Roseibium sp.]